MTFYRMGLSGELPKWLEAIVDTEQLLSRSEQMRLHNDLLAAYETRRVNSECNILFHNSVALIKHNRQSLFFEKAIQRQAMEIISLRARIEALEGKNKKVKSRD